MHEFSFLDDVWRACVCACEMCMSFHFLMMCVLSLPILEVDQIWQKRHFSHHAKIGNQASEMHSLLYVVVHVPFLANLDLVQSTMYTGSVFLLSMVHFTKLRNP